jgi:NitT/TauT family transport system substrate-binding protein
MMTAADELLPLMIKGELDIALIPANVASILYGKMDGNLKVIDINTLGVLYMVSGNGEIDDLKDLEGQTVYLTGKGTTPDYVLRYLLAQAKVDVEKINLEFKSEATEVAAMLAERPDAVGLLPQPFVTAALTQNDKLSVVLDLTEQWDNLQGDTAEASRMVTGVTVVRGEFLEQYPQAVEQFLKDHAESAEYVNSNVEQAATWAVLQGIIAKEPLAKKAIPQCNIVCIAGEEMKKALSGYLQVLFEQSAESVGGKLPAEDFYFVN